MNKLEKFYDITKLKGPGIYECVRVYNIAKEAIEEIISQKDKEIEELKQIEVDQELIDWLEEFINHCNGVFNKIDLINFPKLLQILIRSKKNERNN